MKPEADDIDGATVYDPLGERIGVVDDIYVDETTDQPQWLVVDAGALARLKMVPAAGLTKSKDGYQVGVSKDAVDRAPSVPLEDDVLSEAAERRLAAHYGVPYAGPGCACADQGQAA
jgi:sporulation protein YlmC with PRC-barrel domain